MTQLLTPRGFTAAFDKAGLSPLFFDIETKPLPEDELRNFYPDPPLPSHPGPFLASKVKYGQRKSPESRTAWLLECQERHSAKIVDWAAKCAEVSKAHWQSFVEESTLHSHLSQVAAIGYGFVDAPDKVLCLDIDHEHKLISRFWELVKLTKLAHGQIIGYNSNAFDLPFLTQRSYVLNIHPVKWFDNRYRRPLDFCIDILEHWCFGQYRRKISMQNLAKSLGVSGKLEGVSGKDFHRLLETDREKAREYLQRDIITTIELAHKIMVL